MIECDNAREKNKGGECMNIVTQDKTIDNSIFIPDTPERKRKYRTALAAVSGGLNILLEGKTGTGKNQLFYWIINQVNLPYSIVDCGAINPNLIDSELFGHMKGAFTGAYQDKMGRIEQADGGILFLDEIENASLDFQKRLLTVLQSKTFVPVGGIKAKSISFSLIVATNKNLTEEIQKGNFREDLYQRLKQVRITLAALNEDTDMLMQYIHYFVKKYNLIYETEFDPPRELLLSLLSNSWKGNVRELELEIQKIIYFHKVGIEYDESLGPFTYRNFTLHSLKKMYDDSLRNMITSTLKYSECNISEAAEILQVPRTTLHSHMKRLNITMNRERA
jgi:DNA-binding NtrC family response regulator